MGFSSSDLFDNITSFICISITVTHLFLLSKIDWNMDTEQSMNLIFFTSCFVDD